MEIYMRISDGINTKIIIDRNLLNQLDNLIEDLRPHKVAIITDPLIAELWLPVVKIALNKLGIVSKIIMVQRGERAKTFGTYRRILRELINFGFTRKSLIIGFGGGSVCDLSGFVASTYMRGVPLILIPTTLLAQVDAAIGGKNGIDFIGKNMIGTFYHPLRIVVDPNVLATLDRRDFRSGLAEIVKSAVIMDSEFFNELEVNVNNLKDSSSSLLAHVIAKSIQLKVKVVESDYKENNLRMILNYGHTIGHALEKSLKFRIRHGYAISIGMVVEAFIATRILGFAENDVFRIISLLSFLGLPTKIPSNPEMLIKNMELDKKFWYNKPLMALPKSIGHAELVNVDYGVIKECLEKCVYQ
ncbi:MAG: 3-dehydroquinate synthase [Thermoprotei archaeon]